MSFSISPINKSSILRKNGLTTIFVCFISLLVSSSANAQVNGWFDSWVFQNGQNDQGFRKTMKALAETEIRGLEQLVQLSDLQKEKLRLAAEGDSSRICREIDRVRKLTEHMQPDNNNVNEIQKHITPLRSKMEKGILHESSLFRSVMNQILEPEQVRMVQEREIALRTERVRGFVNMALIRLEKSVPLLQSQREKYLEIAEQKILSQDRAKLTQQMEYMFGEYVLYSLSDEKLKSFLDQHQVDAIKKNNQVAVQYKAYFEGQGLKIDE